MLPGLPSGDSVVASPLYVQVSIQFAQTHKLIYSPYESSSPSTKRGITLIWPIIFSLVGLVAIIGVSSLKDRNHLRILSRPQGVFIFMHLRKHHIAIKANHKWVNRPGGWAQDGAITEEGAKFKREVLNNDIDPYSDAISVD